MGFVSDEDGEDASVAEDWYTESELDSGLHSEETRRDTEKCISTSRIFLPRTIIPPPLTPALVRSTKQAHFRRNNTYKFRTLRDFEVASPIQPDEEVGNEYVRLRVDGTLWIRAGYAWDGCIIGSDTPLTARASLVHDAFYQLIREGIIRIRKAPTNDKDVKKQIDCFFMMLMYHDGMFPPRAFLRYYLTKWFGKHAMRPRPARNQEALTSP